MSRFYFLLLIFCISSTSNINGQTNYFVSTTGSDSNNGTSVATAWKTIQKAANTATPNSTVNILAGTYNELVTMNVGGTPGNPIVFQNYQNGSVILTGEGFSVDYSILISITGKNNIVLDGLILENLTTVDAIGVRVLSDTGIGVENITLKNLKIRNIGFTTDPDTLPVPGDNAHGILVYGQGIDSTDAIKNIIIENCEIYNLITGYSESLTLNGNVDGFSILNNSVHDNTNIGIDIAGNFGASSNPLLDHARNGIVSRNTTFNNISPVAISAGIYCDGCHNTIIEQNVSYNNSVGISVGCEQDGNADSVTVRNNIVNKNADSGISIGGYDFGNTGIVENTVVSNNTCYMNNPINDHGQIVIRRTNNCQFFHNILRSDGNLLFYTDDIAPQNFYSDYNLFYTTTGDSTLAMVNYQWNTIDYATYKSNTNKDLQSVFIQPLFIDTNASSLNLHLLSSSPAINSGNPDYFPSVSEKDIDGEMRANTIIDIGADEYYLYLDTHIACDSFLWIDGNTYTESNNTAIHTVPNSIGLDSIITLDLTINNPTTGVDTHVACDSFLWIDGNTYTESNNTATETLENAAGCDSIVTLNLTINYSTIGVDTQVACDSFLWIDGNTYTESNNTATETLENAAGCDSIVTLNLTINNTTNGVDTHVACDSFLWIDGNTYTESNNTATETLENAAGCDSIVTLNLTINYSTIGVDTQVACDSFLWIDGNTYTESNNTATDTLENSAGCDSIVTLNLTINNTTTGVDTHVACDSFLWIDGNTYTESNNTATETLENAAGCDSIVTLNLTINNTTTGVDTQVACDSFLWIDGNTYTESNNTATDTLENTAGCDSIVTLNLTINTVDTSVTIVGQTITANLVGASYQWLNCDDNFGLISGETNQTYTATANGSYAVEITQNGCVDTSACHTITSVGIIENNFGNKLVVYPNPTNGNITVDLGASYASISTKIFGANGQLISTKKFENSRFLNLAIEKAIGYYLLEIVANNNTKAVIKILKE